MRRATFFNWSGWKLLCITYATGTAAESDPSMALPLSAEYMLLTSTGPGPSKYSTWPETRMLAAPTVRSVSSITEYTAICKSSGESSASLTICIW